MKKSSRRNFIRNTSLTGTGLLLGTLIQAKPKSEPTRAAIGCAPSDNNQLSGTITSVMSGDWSNPSTWGGRVPGTTDTPLIAAGHSVKFDLATASVSGVMISDRGVLLFDSTKSTLLQSTKNAVVEGVLQMRPASAVVIQTLRFIGVNENNFAGGSGMSPLETDTGLWVIGAGKLDLAGSVKTSWTRTTDNLAAGSSSIRLQDIPGGWIAGDEISIAPTEPPSVGDNFSYGFDVRTITGISGSTISLSSGTTYPHPQVNNKWTAEVMNLTRNVRIEGTTNGKSHVFVHSSVPQNISHVQFRYMGVRKDVNGDGIKEPVAGRYGLHFHHCGNGSKGTLVESCVMRDTSNHSYVPHTSHGISFKNNIAYNVLETAFWWDPGHITHETTYDGNIVALCDYVFRALNLTTPDAADAPQGSSSGFLLGVGDDNVCNNNVVVAGSFGDAENGGGFNWEANNEGVWEFENNLSHNNGCGLRIWQVTSRNHVITNYSSYNNAVGVFHGAYANVYSYRGGYHYNSPIQIKASSIHSALQRFERVTFDGAGAVNYLVTFFSSPLPSTLENRRNPNLFVQCVFKNAVTGHITCNASPIDDTPEESVRKIDIVQCSFSSQPGIHITPASVEGTDVRVQPESGQSYMITKHGVSSIAAFAPVVWGTGNGLKGEYYNGSDFDVSAFTRVDSALSFQEWSEGVHHKITSNNHSVRWTGQIQPQFSEAFTFTLYSGGGSRLWLNNQLIIDSWKDKHADRFVSSSMNLVAGQLYDIKLEYFNSDKDSTMNLFWSSPSLPLEIVPQCQLYSGGNIVNKEPLDQSPTVHAGTEIVITLPTNSTTLAGAASIDSNDAVGSYKWTKVSGP
ncbi:MAG TPA: PA14 domain-containing protein, partial [Chitinophagaceae bacterium]|nr:PA14 domain-containing protein [Chitinophagaceae bacterium]